VYPNNKPYILGRWAVLTVRNWLLKIMMNAHKSVQKELNHMLREARRKHKDIIEQNFTSRNSKMLWDSLKDQHWCTPRLC
jgi:creatinine amidohydrolase/Fe(II)-dependent formamide hydrolase-like protein